MGRARPAIRLASSDDDSPNEAIEIRIEIIPRKRRANDGKPTKAKNEAKKRRSGGTKGAEKETKWECEHCDLSYSKKGNLVKHEKKAHSTVAEKGRSKDKDSRKRKSVPKQNQTDETTKNNLESESNLCVLCGNYYSRLYQHYGLEHGIDHVEDILFKSGRALIISSADTKNGTAAWFIKQKEKAEQCLDKLICRLCGIKFNNVKELVHHYTALSSNSGHHVDHKHLCKMEQLFRKDKNAHLEECGSNNASSRMSEAKAAKEKVDINTKSKINADTENIQEMGLIMYICDCGVATDTYDASVEHAQKHLLGNYVASTKKCRCCDLTFEGAWFDAHVSRHGNEDIDVLKTIVYDHTSLLSDEWIDMFSVLADKEYAKKIVESSVYKYTRSVKMNWDVRESGVPLYQCDRCKLFVDPVKVEYHIGACIAGLPLGHYCSECDISFSTANGLKKHKEDHKPHGYRVIVFNSKTDMQSNKALMRHLRPSEENSQESNEEEEIVENPKRLKNNETEKNVKGGVLKFCNLCNRSVPDYDVHSAWHKSETKKKIYAIFRQENLSNIIGEKASGNNIEQKNQVSQVEKDTALHEKDMQKMCTSKVSKDGAHRMDTDTGDSVTLWDSDSDSDSLQHSYTTGTTQANINLYTKDYERCMKKDLPANRKVTSNEKNYKDISAVLEDSNDDIIGSGRNSENNVGSEQVKGSDGINGPSQADTQTEAEPAENNNDVNKVQQQDDIMLSENNQRNTYSAQEFGEKDENNQATNNNSNSPELYLREVGGANDNDTEPLDTNKDDELASTQELIETLGGAAESDKANNKEAQSPGTGNANEEVPQDIVMQDITRLLPIIRLLTEKYLLTKQ